MVYKKKNLILVALSLCCLRNIAMESEKEPLLKQAPKSLSTPQKKSSPAEPPTTSLPHSNVQKLPPTPQTNTSHQTQQENFGDFVSPKPLATEKDPIPGAKEMDESDSELQEDSTESCELSGMQELIQKPKPFEDFMESLELIRGMQELDVQKPQPVLPQDHHPIKFFQNDYRLPSQAESIIEQIAFVLLQGKGLEKKNLEAFQLQREVTAEWTKRVRPQIVLHAQEQSWLSNEYKKNILEKKVSDHVKPFDTSRITDMSVTLDEEKKNVKTSVNGFKLTKRVVQQGSGVADEQTVYIALKSAGIAGTCVALNPYNCDIYIGCKNGTICVFDAHSHEQRKVLSGHSKEIDALAVIDNGRAIVSRDSDGTTFIWSTQDDRPRLVLENIEHSKTYYLNGALIRSHFRGALLSSVVGNDGVYRIPLGYLHGEVPGHDVKHIAFFYLLRRLMQSKKSGIGNVQKLGDFLFNSHILNTFEPKVTESIKKYIEEICTNSLMAVKDHAMQLVEKK